MVEKIPAVEPCSNSVKGTILVKEPDLRAGTGIVLVAASDPYSRSDLAGQSPDHMRPSVAAAVDVGGSLVLDLRRSLEGCQRYSQPILHLYSLL